MNQLLSRCIVIRITNLPPAPSLKGRGFKVIPEAEGYDVNWNRIKIPNIHINQVK
jgi:hypothetical protein